MAFVIDLVLSENATQAGHPCLGLAVGILALPALQFLWPHRYTRGIAADVHDRWWLRARQRHQGLALLPGLRAWPHALDQALDLSGRNFNAPGLSQVLLGLLVAGLIGPFH